MTGYKINPEEWRKMSKEEKIGEILSAFILDHHEEIDDGIVEEAEAAREMLHSQMKGREKNE